MQLIQLERDDWNFHCPATGMLVYQENGEPAASSFRGGWCHEVPTEPMHLAEELIPIWDAYISRQLQCDGDIDVAEFLRTVDLPNWVAFEITTCGMACGPVWSTAWTVLDLNDDEP